MAAWANNKPPVLHFHESSWQARRGALLCSMVSSRGRGWPSRRHLPRRWPTPGKATLDEIAHRLLIGGCAEKERKGDKLAQHPGLCNVNRRQPVFARRRSYTTHCSPGGGTSESWGVHCNSQSSFWERVNPGFGMPKQREHDENDEPGCLPTCRDVRHTASTMSLPSSRAGVEQYSDERVATSHCTACDWTRLTRASLLLTLRRRSRRRA